MEKNVFIQTAHILVAPYGDDLIDVELKSFTTHADAVQFIITDGLPITMEEADARIKNYGVGTRYTIGVLEMDIQRGITRNNRRYDMVILNVTRFIPKDETTEGIKMITHEEARSILFLIRLGIEVKGDLDLLYNYITQQEKKDKVLI